MDGKGGRTRSSTKKRPQKKKPVPDAANPAESDSSATKTADREEKSKPPDAANPADADTSPTSTPQREEKSKPPDAANPADTDTSPTSTPQREEKSKPPDAVKLAEPDTSPSEKSEKRKEKSTKGSPATTCSGRNIPPGAAKLSKADTAVSSESGRNIPPDAAEADTATSSENSLGTASSVRNILRKEKDPREEGKQEVKDKGLPLLDCWEGGKETHASSGTSAAREGAHEGKGTQEAAYTCLPLLDGLKPLRRKDDFELYNVPARKKSSSRRNTDPSTKMLQRSTTASQGTPPESNSLKSEGSSSSSEKSGGNSKGKWTSKSEAHRPSHPHTAALKTKRKSIEELLPLLKSFLSDFEKKGDGEKPYYPSIAPAMNARVSAIFTLDFYDILSDKSYVDLVLQIGNEASHEWMEATVLEFLKSHGYTGTRVVICISHKPVSVDYIHDYMISKPCWGKYLCCKEEVYAASGHGRVGLIAGIRVVIENHRAGISYGGKIKKDDLLIINSSKCWLYAEKLRCNGTNCTLDMSSIWSIFGPYFVISLGSYPLEFEDLIEELTLVTERRVLTEGYRDLIWFYPTLAPPPAREEFVHQFCLAVRGIEGVLDEFLRAIPSSFRPPSTWTTLMGAQFEDWRADFNARVDSVLDSTFWHEVDKAIGGRENFAAAAAANSFKIPFDPTVWGQVWCKRNVLEHAEENGATDNRDLIEFYATSKFKHLLGYLFRKISELKPEEREKFGYAIRAYKKLFG